MKNKKVLPALLGSVALTLGLVTVSTSINKEVVNAATASYVKVSEEPTDWTGDYLIVYEDGGVAFNGGLSTLDAVSNGIDVSIVDGVIESNDTIDAAKFSIAKVDGGYSVKSSSSFYIGQTSDANELKSSSTTSYVNSISLNADGTVNLISGGAYLRYNSAVNQLRFRYYKSSTYTGQKAISLYKYTESITGGDDTDEPTYASSQDIHEVMDDFYNEGTYTKKTEIFLNDDALTEIAEHFHGPVQQDRTTYYTTEDGKEALYMADLNGEISEINSGYSTVNESNIEAVRGKFSSVVEGNMAHFKYNKETEKAEYDYIVKTEDGIAGYYHALDEMFAQDYFGDTAWVVNTNKTFEHTVTGANDAYLEFFLAFAAPCLKSSILTDSNYITVDGMKLVIGTGKNDLNNKEYLSLKMVLVEDETNEGLVDNTEMVLSEARIYAGNDMFNESVMSEEVAESHINAVLEKVNVPTSTSNNFDLTTSDGEVTISWASDNSAIVINGNNAEVNRSNEDIFVNLTATAILGNVSITQTYQVKVEKQTETAQPITATLSFANKAQRTSFTTSQQVWEQNGIILTNDKGSSTSNVGDYANPARFYANSKITIYAPGNIQEIVFTCSGSSYATALKNSIGTVSGATVELSGSKVTVKFTSEVENFTIAKLTAQVRINSMSVTYLQ